MSPQAGARPAGRCRAGFTLIELLMALTILAACMAMTFGVFYSITKAWQRGLAMAENLNRGEFVMDQLGSGLRSAFYPPPQTNQPGGTTDNFGFWLEDNGSGAQARDTISWVKTGPELLGIATRMENGLHRVMLSVEEDADGRTALAARAWRPYTSLLENFDPEDEPPFFLTTRVTGLECRVSTNLLDDGWEWSEQWEDAATNTLPLAVEVVLHLEPLEKDEPAVELKRTIIIPVAPVALRARR